MPKYCRDCRQVLPASEFTRNCRNPDGLSFYCRACGNARQLASRRRRLGPPRNSCGQGPADVPEGMKWCSSCGQVKPLLDFPRNRSQKSGYGSYCKPCHNEIARTNREKKHGSTRNYHLKARYGITADEADRMLAEQAGLCAICREAPAAHIDHDHKTERVRGMLCFNCNQALGNFRDRRDLMLAAVAYLDANGFVPITDRPTFGFSLFHGDNATGRPEDEPPWPDDEQQIA